ncbi:sigma-70 family RNA polymerase sigma factor [Rathayibacter sp. VKM Ac-2803]|uniref:RNA polymerase sigma factor n=1 Tax=Rathayibacter sp. VKM Ac-2803 TaxID=2609256 RepID=UPI00135C7A8C|nr:sigma-70 family RNA polymerase sigma factor [Rathayibacter sp. VKM Ac-2803]MWV47966.1 sigma-70 family RNA polymerase sigma factor [Rathayibacter sp. VKM Ac-2803]
MTRRRRSEQETTLERLHDANAADLLSYFGRRVPVPPDAADLLSETFIVAWRKIRELPDDPVQARMWLFGVARRVLANNARGTIRHHDLAHKLRQHLDTQSAEPVDTDTLDVRAALDALPADQAELVRLISWDGFTLPEAARILGISETTARGRHQRARTRLRTLLGPRQRTTP